MKTLVSLCVVLFTLTRIFAQGIELEEPVRMLALGDSYTIGASVGVEERWPHQFVSELNARGITAVTPDYIAVTGWTTQALLDGIERQLDTTKAYNLVSILIGVNNQYQGIPIDSYEPDLREIIELALEVVSNDTGKVFMVSIPDYAYTPFGSGDEDITNGINAYNDINYRVALEYGLTYVNITSISRRGLDEPGLVASDGLHPSGEQYALWVEAILSWLAEGPFVGTGASNIPAETRIVEIQLSPNPASSFLRIVATPPPVSIRILDLNGRLLAEMVPSKDEIHLDISGVNNGMFLLEGTYPDGKRVVPFLVQNSD